ncbi:MAG TPA: heparinase II/III family protein [Opitutaceae bacterium]|nr:heparinase II/III family protein [Opitutaceae bacterium]
MIRSAPLVLAAALAASTVASEAAREAAALELDASLVNEAATVVPARGPRTLVPAGRLAEFRAYCTTGAGAASFARIKADLDREYLALPFPEEPVTYGDPSPSRRTSAMADLWRAQQDTCGRIAGVAEAATLCWLVTGEDRYLAKAKDFLLRSCAWRFAPDWQAGPVAGATDIYYNDEAHFRLWRKLPPVYDQLRDRLTDAERATVLAHFRERGNRSVRWIEDHGNISAIARNSIAADLSSHPVRFMPMTGITALALWDDLPETREWWAFAYRFYRDQFSPWGGDDGGWAEGPAYWRGTFEHATFQDALLAIGDPLAYAQPFWKNSPYFAVYNVQPYLHTVFGDVSNAGRFNLEPVVADYMEHMARVLGDGHLLSYGALCTDRRTRPSERGLAGLDRTYPTTAEFLVRNFTASHLPLPAPRPLPGLPRERHFADIGLVSLHSALGDPANDIHVTFKSSPYGSFSHSHADQNAFIVNAWGEGLAINSAYREYHNSPHHQQWTRQTLSKNAVLIDGVGQKAQSKESTGRIARFAVGDRFVWSQGDALRAYQAAQPKGRVRRVTRDLVFVDRRYVILRDRVELATPARLSWLLHAERDLTWDRAASTAFIRGAKASLTAKVLLPGAEWNGRVTTEFPVPVDPKYAQGTVTGSYLTGTWHDQAHLTLESVLPSPSFTVWTVLWPEPTNAAPAKISLTWEADAVVIARPDGRTDRLLLTDDSIALH